MDMLQWLSDCLFPTTHEEASELLRLTHSMIQYLTVYQAFFPDDYRHSVALIEQKKAPLFPIQGETYAPHEVRFLEHVDAQLFPLGEREDDERYYTVPITPIGLDDLYMDYITECYDQDAGWLLLFHLLHSVQVELLVDMISEKCHCLFDLPIEQGWVDAEILAAQCQQQQEPLAFLIHALAMIEHDTNTVWLDTTSEVPCDTMRWTPEDIEDIAQQYRQALLIKEKAEACVHWLEEDPLAHFPEVIELWNRCIHETRQQQNKTHPVS